MQKWRFGHGQGVRDGNSAIDQWLLKLCSNTVSIPLPYTVTFLRLLRFIMYKYDYRRPYSYKVYTTSTGTTVTLLIQVDIETEIARISSKTVVYSLYSYVQVRSTSVFHDKTQGFCVRGGAYRTVRSRFNYVVFISALTRSCWLPSVPHTPSF